MSITDPTGPISVQNAQVVLNSVQTETLPVNENIAPLSGTTNYFFQLSDFNMTDLSDGDLLDFSLFAVDADNKQIQTLDGSEPTSFEISIDTEMPTIENVNPLLGDRIKIRDTTENISIEFSEKVRSYKLFAQGELINSLSLDLPLYNMYSDTLTFIIPSSVEFQDNITPITIEFQDLAGNWNSANYTLVLIGDSLEIKLLTRKDRNDLTYFYNSSLPNLFGTTIYSDSSSYNLVLETSHPSNCYYTGNLFSFKSIDESHVRDVASASQNNLEHTLPVNTNIGPKIWVACQKIIDPEDVVYLSEVLFEEKALVDVEHYTGKLQIQNVIPSSLITNNIFDIYLNTNENSLCHYGIDSTAVNPLNTTNLKDHSYLNEELYLEGTHRLDLSCIDVLGDTTTYSSEFLLNTTLGVKILSYTPDYTPTTSTKIEYKLSTPADCRVVSQGQIITTNESFFSLPKATQTSSNLDYSTTISSLSTGENIITFSCLKSDQLFNGEKIKIIYDPNGPVLSNLQFSTGGGKGDYVASYDEIGYSVDVNSVIKVNKFFIEVFAKNETIRFEKGSESAKVKGDFEGATKIRIIGQNAKGINSTPIEKVIKFDLNPPQITFTKQGNSVVINCFDTETECENIEYGFSSTSFTCNVFLDYEGGSIDVRDNNYICAEAKDLVGHETREQLQLVAGLDEFDIEDDNFESEFDIEDDELTTENESTTEDFIEDDFTDNEFIDDVPFNPQDFESNDDNTTTYSIIAALVTLLGSLGGGGYYAYKKGYLNKHLEKFGFAKKAKENAKPSVAPTTVSKQDIAPKENKNIKPKGSYNDHYKKLNNFLDKTLDSKSHVFKDFDKSNKGKVKGYEDTLIKGRKSDLSKEEFDEFYSSSKNSNVKGSKSLESEAEDFEEYHKKKKQNNKKSK